MLTIKKVDKNEIFNFITYDVLDASLKKKCDSNNKQYFVVIQGDKILGHALVQLFENISIAQIIEIYILPQERKQGLGDALLKTILHYLRINLFTYAIIKGSTHIEDFLINNGAEQVDFRSVSEQIKTVIEKDFIHNYYLYNIEEFFKRKCKGSQLI